MLVILMNGMVDVVIFIRRERVVATIVRIKGKFECEGQDYHTRLELICPMHSLAYEIEYHVRAQMAKHPILIKLIHAYKTAEVQKCCFCR